jgi:vacuolar-type H+-ATPase subunit H
MLLWPDGGRRLLREIIERILKSEEDAKAMEQEAREKAKKIVEEGRREAAGIIAGAREAAREEASRVLEDTRRAATEEHKRILDEARAASEAMPGDGDLGNRELIEEAVRKISGLER